MKDRVVSKVQVRTQNRHRCAGLVSKVLRVYRMAREFGKLVLCLGIRMPAIFMRGMGTAGCNDKGVSTV